MISLDRRLAEWAVRKPDAPAFTFLKRGEAPERELTFAGLDRRARQIAAQLSDAGLAGQPVALIYPSGLEFIEAFCGCLYAGAIPAALPLPANARAAGRCAVICRATGFAAILTASSQLDAPALEPVRAAVPDAPWICTDEAPEDAEGLHIEVEGGAPAFLQFTSGSTSEPRGVVITHDNLTANQQMIADAFGYREDECSVGWLPLHHDMGLVGTVLQPIHLGARSVLMSPQSFLQKPVRWLKAISAYPALHQGPPIAWSDEEGAWMIHRYADVAAAMKDPRLEVGEPPQAIRALAKLAGKDVEALALLLEEVLFLRNPPAHGPGRQFLVAVLNEQPLSVHQAKLEEIVRRLLAQSPDGEEWDAATAYADVAPPLFMAGLLGLSEEDGLAVIGVMNEVTKSFDRARSLRFYERVSKTVETARALVDANIRRRRAAPTADGLGRMMALNDARFGLSDTVIANRVLFLLMAGAETTSALIASTIAAVAERPDVAARVRADPGLAQAAVEETLRFDGPVKQSSRIASCDTTVAGQPIKSGDRIVLLVGAAHHDPEAFPDPERFDIDRSTERLLGFGAGLHFCIGAALARMEARVALNEILRRGELSLRSEGRSWLQHRTLRRLEHLPLTIDRFGEDAKT